MSASGHDGGALVCAVSLAVTESVCDSGMDSVAARGAVLFGLSGEEHAVTEEVAAEEAPLDA